MKCFISSEAIELGKIFHYKYIIHCNSFMSKLKYNYHTIHIRKTESVIGVQKTVICVRPRPYYVSTL